MMFGISKINTGMALLLPLINNRIVPVLHHAKEVKPEKFEYDFGVIYTVAHKEKSIINYYTWTGTW